MQRVEELQRVTKLCMLMHPRIQVQAEIQPNPNPNPKPAEIQTEIQPEIQAESLVHGSLARSPSRA